MNDREKTREQLADELQLLRRENEMLKASYEKDIAWRKQTQMKLLVSEEQKNAILNGITTNIAFVDMDLKIIWANKTAATSVNRTPDEMKGHTCYHLWANPEGPCENCPSVKALETKKTEQTIMHTPDGKVWEERGEPIFDAEGNLIGIVEIATDITDRIQMEEALRESETLYRSILKASPDSIAITDLEGRILMFSQAAKTMWGYDREEDLLGHFIENFMAPGDRDRAANDIDLMFKGIRSGPAEYHGLRKDGSTFDFEANGEFIRSADGHPAQMIFIVRDITERKRMEEEKRKTDSRIRTLSKAIEQSPVTTVITDVSGNIEFVNPKFTETTGYTAEEAIGQNPRILKGGDKSISVYKELWDTILSGQSWHGVFQNKKKNGELYWESAVISPVKDEEGSVTHFLAVKEDITSRIQADEALRESEEKYRILTENLKDVVWTLDTQNLRFLYVSPSVKKLRGYTPEEIIAQPMDAALTPEAANFLGSFIQQQVQDLLAGRESFDQFFTSEVEQPCKDGTTVWTEVVTNFFMNEKTGHIELWGVTRDITERKKAEDALRESETKFKTLFEAANDAIFILIGNVFIDCNYKTETLFRCKKTDIIGHTVQEYSPPEQPDGQVSSVKAWEKINNALADKLQFFEWKHQRFDGTTFDTEVSLSKLELNGDTFLQAIVRDITDRKRSQDTLMESELRYRTLFSASPSGIIVLDENGIIIEANEAITKTTLYSHDELIGSSILKITSPDKSHLVAENIKRILAGEILEQEVVNIRKDGTFCIFLLKETAITLPNGKLGVLSVSNDISEGKQAEEALKQTSARLSLATRAARVGVWDYDLVNNIILWDDQMFSLYGLDKKSFGGTYQAWLAGVHPDDAVQSDTEIRMAICGEKELDTEFRVCWPDGSVHNIRALATVQHDDSGKPLHMIGTNWDITDQKKTEEEIKYQNEELQKLNATKDKFFSIIGHDLKSPFNTIVGFSELLVEQVKEKDYEGIEKYAGIIRQSSMRALNLLMNLMEWARSQTGRMDFNPEYFELVDMINETALLFTDLTHQKSISFRLKLPSHAAVYADKAMISTVLRNLISNAIKFTMPGGELIVAADVKPNEVTISVKDTGVGIPKNLIDNLFRIDENFSTPGTQNEKGTGLGLILCKEFAEKHGGKIQVESEVGKGTAFYFTIPCNCELSGKNANTYCSSAKDKEVQVNSESLGLKVLVAEDDETSEALISGAMETICNELLKARTGIEAIEACRNNPDIDLVMMDIKRPVMDGYEATRQIRQFNKNVIIIAQTSYGLNGDRGKAIAAGCNDYIFKPLDLAMLKVLIKKHLK